MAQRPPALPPRNLDHDHRRYRRNSFIQSMENGPSDEGTPSPESEEYLSPMQRQQMSQMSQGGRSNSSRHVSHDSDHRVLNNSRSANYQQEAIQNQQNVQRMKNNSHRGGGYSDFDPKLLPAMDRPDVERWLASQPPDGAARRRLRSDESDHIPDSPSPPGSYHSDDTSPQQRYGSHFVI